MIILNTVQKKELLNLKLSWTWSSGSIKKQWDVVWNSMYPSNFWCQAINWPKMILHLLTCRKHTTTCFKKEVLTLIVESYCKLRRFNKSLTNILMREKKFSNQSIWTHSKKLIRITISSLQTNKFSLKCLLHSSIGYSIMLTTCLSSKSNSQLIMELIRCSLMHSSKLSSSHLIPCHSVKHRVDSTSARQSLRIALYTLVASEIMIWKTLRKATSVSNLLKFPHINPAWLTCRSVWPAISNTLLDRLVSKAYLLVCLHHHPWQ